MFSWHWQAGVPGADFKDSHLCICHFLNVFHRSFVQNALYGFVDDAVPYGEDGFSRVCVADVLDELFRSLEYVFQAFYVLGPWLVLQFGDDSASEVAPVSFSEQGGAVDFLLPVRFHDDLAGLHGAPEVA